METISRNIGLFFIALLLQVSSVFAQNGDTLIKDLKLSLGAEIGASACFQDRANSVNNTLRKGNAFADPFVGFNVCLSYKNAFIESGWLRHQVWMTYEVVDEAIQQANESRSFSDASTFREIPLRIGWTFPLSKNKYRGFYIAPSIGIAFIKTKAPGLNFGGRKMGSSVSAEDTIRTSTEYAFYRLREKLLAFSLGLRYGYNFERVSLSIQSSFAYNPNDWFSGEVRYLRESQKKGTLFDQGFLYWKTSIWSASFSVRYLVW